MNEPIVVFWFRRDLRLNDNHALYQALTSGNKVLPLFIFDTGILDKLNEDDKRLVFIHNQIHNLNKAIESFGRSLQVFHGEPAAIMEMLASQHNIRAVYCNHDYEPYSIARDTAIASLLKSKGISLETFKDQVLFEKSEIVKSDNSPYVVFTPYSRRWLEMKQKTGVPLYPSENFLQNFAAVDSTEIPTLSQMGFKEQDVRFSAPEINEGILNSYAETRNFPGLDNTTRLGHHLRFGTISIRDCIKAGEKHSQVWLNELIWREFFMQILWHFPKVEKSAFRSGYDKIIWNNDPEDFEKWCTGNTGYPLVDAGMRELNQTGFMHNRVRMVVASFLTKHLLIDWRWGEAYFAEKLLDFELSSNNGNWQWAAGSGCDAAPYFRIFNPSEQLKKFDKEFTYVKHWVPEYSSINYVQPMVDHQFARQRCLSAYANALKQ
ncbi:MAG: hypothetical protein FD170_966 [Bacteroidetes bacterium]|nr:MAG: hypothetical protein FD170_966 [Bacteroidota bacterium]